MGVALMYACDEGGSPRREGSCILTGFTYMHGGGTWSRRVHDADDISVGFDDEGLLYTIY